MTRFRSAMTTALMAAVLSASQAMAADGPLLAPGKPGGVRTAQRTSPSPLLITGVALVVVAGLGIAIATSNDTQCGSACAAPDTSP